MTDVIHPRNETEERINALQKTNGLTDDEPRDRTESRGIFAVFWLSGTSAQDQYAGPHLFPVL